MSLSSPRSSDIPLNRVHLRRLLKIKSNPPVIDLTNHISCGDFVAEGGSGTIYKGKWRNNRMNAWKVALKVIRLPPMQDEVQKSRRFKLMKRELDLWPKINHENILPLLGFACIDRDPNRPAFVSPWMSNGNVIDFLEQNPTFAAHIFLEDVIKGLDYLHTFEPEIVHGDIKGANVLITHRLEACLCDFGLSRFALENTLWKTTSDKAGGTLRWMAPELLAEDVCKPTTSSDMYAYGMTCYQILSRKLPFEQVRNEAAVISRVMSGQRPERMGLCTCDEIWSIITLCWSQEPLNRPTASDVLELIQDISPSQDDSDTEDTETARSDVGPEQLEERFFVSRSYIESYSMDEQLQEPPREVQNPPSTFYLLDHFISYVFEFHYPFVNRPKIKEMVLRSVRTHPASREIVRILSNQHYGSSQPPRLNDHSPSIIHYLKRTGADTLDDAMVALYSVFVYLPFGGDGASECIDFAARHVKMLVNNAFHNISNPLRICDAKTAFVIKTAIWFDVLASITTERSPRLRPVVDKLFSPARTHLLDLEDPLVDRCSMLFPMGCENHVVWAISEISNLAHWKRQQQEKGYLSITELVTRSMVISQILDNPVYDRDELEEAPQYSASNIFRAAAHLYLATIVHSDHIAPEVRRQALRVYDAILAIPPQEEQLVVRSTVFAFFLCGCFLTDLEHQNYIKDMLLYQEESMEISNWGSIVDLLDLIWENSNPDYSHAIPWRSLLKKKQILLV